MEWIIIAFIIGLLIPTPQWYNKFWKGLWTELKDAVVTSTVGGKSMSGKPILIQCMIYPRNKTVAPYPATITGVYYDPSLSIGGGPIIPPPDIPVEPPLEIWPNPPEGQAPIPSHPIVLPGDPGWEGPDGPPPDQPPSHPEAPHPGWNWSAALSQWVWCYIPGSGQAQPKKK